MFWNAHRTVLDKTLVLCALSSHASLALTTKCELLLKAFHLNQAVLERTLSHWALCWDWIAKARNSFSLGNAAEFSFPLTLRPSGFFQHVCLNFQTDLSSADLRRFVYLTRNSYSWEQQQTFYLTTQQVYENNVLRCWENSIWNHEIRRIQWSFKWQKKKKKKKKSDRSNTSERCHYCTTSITKRNCKNKQIVQTLGQPLADQTEGSARQITLLKV